MRKGAVAVGVVALLVMVIVAAIGLRNAETPAGYAGYVTRGAIIGKTEFHSVQYGPTSTGLGWLLHVNNVSITPYTYTEEFVESDSVLSKDNLKIGFRVDVGWKVRRSDEAVRTFFEGFSILEQGTNADKVAEVAYANFVRKPLRSFALVEVQRRDGLMVKDELAEIGAAIKQQVDAFTAETPFEVSSVVVGNVQYPPEVAGAVAKKLAATQTLEQQETQLKITGKQADQRVAEAKGIANAMRIINERLTAAYLQHEAIEAQKAMVGSPNHTTIYIPVGANGVPLVGALDMSPRSASRATAPLAAAE